MSTVTIAPPVPVTARRPETRSRSFGAFTTLARRRLALSAHTPREVLVPLMTPILFAVIIAPALAKTTGAIRGMDYMSYLAVGTVGLLVPISCMFAGIGVLVDRASGARQDMLAAPIRRYLMVFGNLTVALLVSALQVVTLLGAAILRGAQFEVRATGILWFAAASAGLAVAMYGVAETLANRMRQQEEYVGALPAVAIVPFFVAGSLFPISALPDWLASVAKLLPLTHALALMRYGLLDRRATGLRDIWGMSSGPAMAALSLAVVVLYAVGLLTLAVRVFNRAAVS
jgi:ABC-2 type transport system permease protein